MMRAVQFDRATMSDIEELGFARFMVEFDAQGSIYREIGIGEDGKVVHRFPGTPTLDPYGMMGPNEIVIVGENPSAYAILMEPRYVVPMSVFEELWSLD